MQKHSLIDVDDPTLALIILREYWTETKCSARDVQQHFKQFLKLPNVFTYKWRPKC